jgi:threonine dehydrogenase-like Zn-dependent dehydrogenase
MRAVRVRPGGLRVDQSVAIVGAGSIGLLVLALVKRAGARPVLVSDPNPRKRGLALELGADRAIDPSDGLPAQRFDVAFECVGRSQTINDTLALARPGGTAVLVGVAHAHDRPAVDVLSLQQRDLTIAACNVRRHTYYRTPIATAPIEYSAAMWLTLGTVMITITSTHHTTPIAVRGPSLRPRSK